MRANHLRDIHSKKVCSTLIGLTIFFLLFLAGSRSVNAQWTTPDSNITIIKTNSGKVGRGTASPGQTLSVNGNIDLKGNNNSTRWVVTDQDATGSTRLSFQAGAGSSSFGGALHLWGAGQTSKSGWVTVAVPN